MLTISMFSSSRDLRAGLHRAAALLVRAAAPAEPNPWWKRLPPELSDKARAGQLALADFRSLLGSSDFQALLQAGAQVLGVALPERARLDRGFADAILSSRALQAQGGRDVYGGSNKWLWDALVMPVLRAAEARYGPVADPWEGAAGFEEAALERLERLITFDTTPGGDGFEGCAAWLREQLGELGFEASIDRPLPGSPPILVARRPARGMRGSGVLYGHYDVTSPGPGRWRHDPTRLTRVEDRLWGRGVGDNKGPLAARLAALARLERSPALTWVLQGEEETGSPAAHALFPSLLGPMRPTLWLDETGYHDHEDGTLRLIARRRGPGGDEDPDEDAAFARLLVGMRCLADAWGVGSRKEVRGLNKAVVEGGCPFEASLPVGARYLALGVNDSRARIHGLDESIPTWTFALHLAELRLLFNWVDRESA